MQFELKHLNGRGNLSTSYPSISYLAFVKHLAFVGIGIHKSPTLLFRYLGYFFEFMQYWRNDPEHFCMPSVLENDPSEKAVVSNRIGRAMADYCAKKIYHARFTHSYEDAMIRNGYQIKGKRPDLYCDSLNKQFAIEAKGYSQSSVSDTKMNKHKSQSQKGPIPINFSVASVSFNLYKSPKVKFYDPEDESVEYSSIVNSQLRSLYYNSLLELIEYFGLEKVKSGIPDYNAYIISPLLFPEYRLLIHQVIVSKEWGGNEWLPPLSRESNEENYYIDNDGIGLTNR